MFFQNKHSHSKILFDASFYFSEYKKLLNTINTNNKNEQEKFNAFTD